MWRSCRVQTRGHCDVWITEWATHNVLGLHITLGTGQFPCSPLSPWDLSKDGGAKVTVGVNVSAYGGRFYVTILQMCFIKMNKCSKSTWNVENPSDSKCFTWVRKKRNRLYCVVWHFLHSATWGQQKHLYTPFTCFQLRIIREGLFKKNQSIILEVSQSYYNRDPIWELNVVTNMRNSSHRCRFGFEGRRMWKYECSHLLRAVTSPV